MIFMIMHVCVKQYGHILWDELEVSLSMLARHGKQINIVIIWDDLSFGRVQA